MKHHAPWLNALIMLIGLLFGQYTHAKALRMAANYDSQPFLYVDQDGHLIGFEVELIQEIGKLKNFEVEIVPAIFPKVFDNLRDGSIDFIGHVYNDDDRKTLYNLTTPHYVEKVSLLTLADKNITDPFSSGLTYATLAFSPLEKLFHHEILPDYPELKNKSDETTFLGFRSLFLKEADILLTTKTNVDRLTKTRSQFQYQPFSLPEQYTQEIAISFLTAKNNVELVNIINDGLQELKSNGTYDLLKKKYNLL